jgi:hypothetical protein
MECGKMFAMVGEESMRGCCWKENLDTSLLEVGEREKICA